MLTVFSRPTCCSSLSNLGVLHVSVAVCRCFAAFSKECYDFLDTVRWLQQAWLTPVVHTHAPRDNVTLWGCVNWSNDDAIWRGLQHTVIMHEWQEPLRHLLIWLHPASLSCQQVILRASNIWHTTTDCVECTYHACQINISEQWRGMVAVKRILLLNLAKDTS